jgi:putative ABC transport system permease protein
LTHLPKGLADVARGLPIAWLQLTSEKVRFAVALSGVAFAVVLVAMQLGFRSSVYESAVRYHHRLDYDLVMLSPKTPFIALPESFPRRRLYQVLAADGVESVTPVYADQAYWRNPWTFLSRPIFVIGFNPSHDVLAIPAVRIQLNSLKVPDVVLFDALSRPEFGPVQPRFEETGAFQVEVNNRRVTIAGLFSLGTSFGLEGSLVTSDLNFLRMFPSRPEGFVNFGLIHLKAGTDADVVAVTLRQALERDVEILTRAGFVEREERYWATTTPVGYVFSFGALMGLVVGCVVVYQILFADVLEHSAEYATLKAVGYRNRDLSMVVLREAGILAVIGYAIGLAIVFPLYEITSSATRLPLEMGWVRAVTILAVTAGMCALAGLMALRQVRLADPAEVFG